MINREDVQGYAAKTVFEALQVNEISLMFRRFKGKKLRENVLFTRPFFRRKRRKKQVPF